MTSTRARWNTQKQNMQTAYKDSFSHGYQQGALDHIFKTSLRSWLAIKGELKEVLIL